MPLPNEDIVCIGILNVTPDSFSDGGAFMDYDSAMRQAEYLAKSGADIVDVGGESTRPGSLRVTPEEELARVLPVIEGIKKNIGCTVSIDSYKPEVIKEALKHGAGLVNDISNGKAVLSCAGEIKESGASILVMQNLSPDGISGSVSREDLRDPLEVFMAFMERTSAKLRDSGIDSTRVMFDPGIGFGLSIRDISRVLKNVASITSKIPLCIGLSRKSYIGRLTGISTQDRDSISNSISLHLMLNGVKIFRTHDPAGLRAVEKIYREFADV